MFGWLMVTAGLKMAGYPDAHPRFGWPELPLFIRDHGWTLLALPVAWIVFAFLSKRRDGPPWQERLGYLSGYGMLAFLLWFYIGQTLSGAFTTMHVTLLAS